MNHDENISEKIKDFFCEILVKVCCFFGWHDYIHDLTQYGAISKMLILLWQLKASKLSVRSPALDLAMKKCDYACLYCNKKKKNLWVTIG